MSLHQLREDEYQPITSSPVRLDDPISSMLRPLTVTRSLGVAARIGLFDDLADGPVAVEQLADGHGLQAEPLRLMLNVLVAEHYLECTDRGYVICAPAREWLDPQSPTSVTDLLSYSLDFWDWWTELDEDAAGGAVASTKPEANDSLGWLRHVRARFQWARIFGEPVADAIELPRYARSVLELGTAHGWFSAMLCRRNPRLRATVIDEAPAIDVGRELIWNAGLEDVVTHRAGDMMTAPLGGPYDAVFCLPLLTGLDDDGATQLLRQARSALNLGGSVITLRHSSSRAISSDPAFAWHELFLRLISRPDPSTPEQFRDQLRSSGFSTPRVQELAVAPRLSIYAARAV